MHKQPLARDSLLYIDKYIIIVHMSSEVVSRTRFFNEVPANNIAPGWQMSIDELPGVLSNLAVAGISSTMHAIGYPEASIRANSRPLRNGPIAAEYRCSLPNTYLPGSPQAGAEPDRNTTLFEAGTSLLIACAGIADMLGHPDTIRWRGLDTTYCLAVPEEPEAGYEREIGMDEVERFVLWWDSIDEGKAHKITIQAIARTAGTKAVACTIKTGKRGWRIQTQSAVGPNRSLRAFGPAPFSELMHMGRALEIAAHQPKSSR